MNSKTLLYILKRLALAVLTVWIVITVTFFVTRAVPGGPFMSEKALSAEAEAALKAKYGLDKPVFEQYTTYLKDIVTRLDFGPSLKNRGRTVMEIISEGMAVSVKLGLIAAGCATAIGIVLGAVAALRRNKIVDKVIMVITTAFVSMPSFIMGTLFLLIFVEKLQWVGAATSAEKGGLVLPIITLSLYPAAYITRLTRSSMLDVLGQDYIRTARAKGLSDNKVHYKHALRNVLSYMITMVSGTITVNLGGATVLEKVFNVEGVGLLSYSSLFGKDYPQEQAILIFFGAIFVFMNIFLDIVYKILDPRIELD